MAEVLDLGKGIFTAPMRTGKIGSESHKPENLHLHLGVRALLPPALPHLGWDTISGRHLGAALLPKNAKMHLYG